MSEFTAKYRTEAGSFRHGADAEGRPFATLGEAVDFLQAVPGEDVFDKHVLNQVGEVVYRAAAIGAGDDS